MRKGTYKIIIKGTEKGVAVKCKGNTSKLDVMSGMTQAFMGTAKNLGFTIGDLIKCLEDETPKERKTTRKSAKKTQEKTAAKKTRKTKGETKND